MTGGVDGGPGPEAAWPVLTVAQLTALEQRGTPQEVAAGDVLFRAGDRDYDLIIIETGSVEIIREERPDAPAEVVATHGPGRFIGELNMLTGQAAYLTCRVKEAGRIHRIPPAGFRRLMAEDAVLSDVILKAFLARRQILRTGEGARSVGSPGTELEFAL